MRRTLLISACFTAILMTGGCSSETSSGTESGGPVTLYAAIEQPVRPTRLALAEGETPGVYDLVWSDGDAIAVIGTEGGSPRTSRFSLAAGAGTPKGSFSGTLSESGEAPYYAVFPYQAGATLTDGCLRFPIPQRVPAGGDNIGPAALPAVARVSTDGTQASIALHNLFGLLKFTFTSASAVDVKKIVLHDLGGNLLWGNCSVPVVAGEPDYASATLAGGTNSVSLVWDEAVTFNASARSLYFPVPAGSLDRGFSLVLYEQDLTQADSVGRAWTFLQKISSPVAAGRSTIVEIDAAALSAKPEPLDVKARGYYKSLFVDGGMYLTSNDSTKNLPAIEYLGLENDYEYFGSSVNADVDGSDYEINLNVQNGVMVSAPSATTVTWSDANGVLLYPDGAPRFRMMYVNGGKSSNHGPTLTAAGREQVHDFYMNGGSYAGTCAGMFLGCKNVNGTNRYDNADPSKNYTFGIWPGRVNSSHLPKNITDYPTVFTGQKILPDMGPLGYYDFAAGDTLEDVRHHGGGYLPHNAANAALPHEELLSFQYSDHSSVADTSRYTVANTETMEKFRYNDAPVVLKDSVSTWAYKASSASGRAVLCGSHPEGRYCNKGRQRDLMSFMLRYAMDGNGDATVKTGNLEIPGVRLMNQSTSAGDPGHTGIGDRQYHHFRLVAASDIPDFELTLRSSYGPASGVTLCLALRKDDLAWISDADYVLCNRGGNKKLSIKRLPAGTWYVSVYCETTVTATPTEIPTTTSRIAYWNYTGHTEVLDGIAYSLGINDQPVGIPAPSPYPGTSLGAELDD